MSLFKESYSLVRTIYSHPYNRRKPFFALYRLLRWQLHKKLSSRRRVYAYWGTRKVSCYPDSPESMWLVYNYYMDWDEFHFIKRYVRQASVVLDVGANIGVYTLWISQYLGNEGRLIAFEPDPQNCRRCAENIEQNSLEMVRLEQIALSNRGGKLEFSVGKDVENHLMPDDAVTGSSIAVEGTTLDEYCQLQDIARIDFLKIDVEGAELLVLQGATNALARSMIGVIQLELTDALKRYGIERSDLVELLHKHDYSLYTYSCVENRLHAVQEDDETPQNVYAIHDIDGVHSRLQAPQYSAAL